MMPTDEQLAAKIAEWAEDIGEAAHDLDAALLDARPGDQLKIAVDEAGLELDLARQELAAIREANERITNLASKLDAEARETLARVVEPFCCADWRKADWPKRVIALGWAVEDLRQRHSSSACTQGIGS